MSTKDGLTEAKAPVAEVEDDSLEADDTKNVLAEPGVKFEPAKNGDAVIQMDVPESSFAGLGKEELMKMAYEPFWVRLRWFLFILFWLSWLGMIAGAIGIIIITPKCVSRPDWQKYPVYQIFGRSFQDSSDGTGVSGGIGDLAGIRQRLPYLVNLGIKTVGISPVYKSTDDAGYAVSNFTLIDERHGSMKDFEALVKDAKERGLSVILDLIPNHSSDEHEWFKKSLDKNSAYADYYIWNDGKKDEDDERHPPNNWACKFGLGSLKTEPDTGIIDYPVFIEVDPESPKEKETGCGSAWEWNEERQQYYYHQFSKHQPDLNLRNPKVVDEIKTLLRFWLDKGVSGFRMDSVPYLFESEDLRDEADPNNATLTFNLPEVYDFLHEVRQVLREYEEKDGKERLLLTEGYVSLEKLALYYRKDDKDIAEMPMNVGLIAETEAGMTGTKLYKFISEYLAKLNELSSAWPNWVVGNHDRSRVASRLTSDLVDGINMIAMLLPGTPITYYGEEIGMTDNRNAPNIGDFQNRYGFGSPMQWTNGTNAGFSQASSTWIPVNEDYSGINVAAQESAEESHLKVYKELVSLRGLASALYGGISYPVVTDDIFSFARNKTGNPSLLVAVNVGDSERTVNFVEKGLPASLTVKLRSVGFGTNYTVGSSVDASKVVLHPKNGIVFTY